MLRGRERARYSSNSAQADSTKAPSNSPSHNAFKF